jgi:hypothetical protein
VANPLTLAAHAMRDFLLPKTDDTGDPGLTTTPDPENVG